MSSFIRREFPIVVMAFSGLVIVFAYYFTFELPIRIAQNLQAWCTFLAAFSIGIGVVILIRHHFIRLIRRTKGEWYLSAWGIAVYCIYTAWGIIKGTQDASYIWVFQNVLSLMFMAMQASTAFFLTSAAFRAFRAKTIEAFLMLTTGLLVMVKSMPMAETLSVWLVLPGMWMFDVWTTAGLRGMGIGIAIGLISMGIRNLLGYEKIFVKF